MSKVLPIDEWTDFHFLELKYHIECHLSMFFPDDGEDDVYSLRRLFFISLRQDLQEKEIFLND